MKVVTAREMQEIDRAAINERGIPGVVLMAVAGKSVADYIRENTGGLKRAAVFSGTGNNGGDGFAAAYYLACGGTDADIFLAGAGDRVSPAAAVFLKLCINSGLKVHEIQNDDAFPDICEYDVILDALTGTGFTGSARGIVSGIIRKMNVSGKKIISIDLPSGLGSDGGAPDGDVVRAHSTVTIGLPKISLVTWPGKKLTGSLHVADIGFPRDLVKSDAIKTELIDDEFVRGRLSGTINPDTHKSERGHLMCIGGFDGMEGAIMMCAMSALRTGIGLLTLITTENARRVIAGKIPEMMTAGIDMNDSAGGMTSRIDSLMASRTYGALIIGPGMGREEKARILFNHVIDSSNELGIKRILVDGDGLYHFADYIKEKKPPGGAEYVITPHFLEAARIIGRNVDEIKRNRFSSASDIARLTAAVTLLKGPSSIVSDGEFSLINTTGNPSLATGGSGDVLSGIIGALLLRDLSTRDAAGIGAYLHGKAADLYCMDHASATMKATDLAGYLDAAMSIFNLKISA